MLITKADGTTEPFKAAKLRRSLRRSGAHTDEINDIVAKIEAELHEGMKTQEIYRKAFQYLRDSELPHAARYSLRRALFNLGPTGFPFEDFLARMFQHEGYTVRKRITIAGSCATHELDVAGYKSDHSFVAEAKFHSRPGIKSDLQVVMYSHARQLDLKDQPICTEDICGIKDFMVITNTKFTSTAERYASCVGLQLLSWNYPDGNDLQDRIEATGLYPITVLQTISAAQKRTLIERNIIVCSDLVKRPQVLRHLHLSPRKSEAVLSEARQLSASS
jgi:hypothetical protein